jgi:hypothetical protein
MRHVRIILDVVGGQLIFCQALLSGLGCIVRCHFAVSLSGSLINTTRSIIGGYCQTTDFKRQFRSPYARTESLTLISAYAWPGPVSSMCQCVLILMANIFLAHRYVGLNPLVNA